MNFGSILKDHPEVLKKSQLYPTLDISLWWDGKPPYRTLPESFDGRDAWEAYTCFPGIQQCADSWAMVAKDILADKFLLGTGGELVVQLSESELIACIDTDPLQKLKDVASTTSLNFKNSCQGYSIYDAWEYTYAYGLPENNCFSHEKLKNYGLKMPEDLTFVQKKETYGTLCRDIEDNQTQCIFKKNGLPVARRSFLSNGILNISQYKNGTFLMDKTIETIKYELLRYGPVAAGFLIFENFVNGYDGTTIYESASGKVLGGHYVSIMGWEKNNGVEYWICRNSWGTDWGLIGFFKMKIGIKECMLEQNVSTVTAYFFDTSQLEYPKDTVLNGKQIDFTDMKLVNPELYEKSKVKRQSIDDKTFYTKEITQRVIDGKLYGSLDPLIANPHRLLPNQRFFWAADFKQFKFVNLNNNFYNKDIKSNHIFFILLCIFMIFLGYITK